MTTTRGGQAVRTLGLAAILIGSAVGLYHCGGPRLRAAVSSTSCGSNPCAPQVSLDENTKPGKQIVYDFNRDGILDTATVERSRDEYGQDSKKMVVRIEQSCKEYELKKRTGPSRFVFGPTERVENVTYKAKFIPINYTVKENPQVGLLSPPDQAVYHNIGVAPENQWASESPQRLTIIYNVESQDPASKRLGQRTFTTYQFKGGTADLGIAPKYTK